MDLPRTILQLSRELKICYSKALSMQFDFSAGSLAWIQDWSVRNQWLSKAEAVDQKLRPLVLEWNQNRYEYSQSIQTLIERTKQELANTIRKLIDCNSSFLESIRKERNTTKSKLLHLNKSKRAIGCYAGQA